VCVHSFVFCVLIYVIKVRMWSSSQRFSRCPVQKVPLWKRGVVICCGNWCNRLLLQIVCINLLWHFAACTSVNFHTGVGMTLNCIHTKWHYIEKGVWDLACVGKVHSVIKLGNKSSGSIARCCICVVIVVFYCELCWIVIVQRKNYALYLVGYP